LAPSGRLRKNRPQRSGRAGNFLLITIILALVIVYGSLYPFHFHAGNGTGPLRTLLATWHNRPGRGDFLANILLYMPFGYFCFLALGERMAAPWRIAIAMLCGVALSVAMELVQYYDDRDTEATDVYSNTIGTLFGVCCTFAHPGRLWGKALLPNARARIPLMLLAAWAAYKLYPFVPVIDLHKYWHAIRPLLVVPQLYRMDLYRHFATWSVCAAALHRATGGKHAPLWYLAFAGAVMVAKIFVVGASLSQPELEGVGLGFCLLLLAGRHGRTLAAICAVLLLSYVVTARLEPFQWLAVPRAFGWIPFLSLMQGSINIDILSFLEKFFLYGGLIWLLRECGVPIRQGTLAVAMVLFATSWAERYLPGRSAEITDAALAITTGFIFALVEESPRGGKIRA
jgi:VanZ family protein